MLAGDDRQSDDGIFVDSNEAARLSHAATFLQMLEDGEGFRLGKFGAIKRRAFAFREALLAGATSQDAALLVGSIAEAHPQVVAATLAVVGAVRVLAAEDFQVVHGVSCRQGEGEKVVEQLQLA